MSRSHVVSIEVEISEFSEEARAEYLREGDWFVSDSLSAAGLFSGIDAYKSGDDKRIKEWARSFLQDATGKVLP